LPAASGIFNVEDKEIKSLLKSEEYEIFSNINLPFHEVPENSANYLLTLAKKISSTQELCHYLATMPWGDEVYNIEMHYNLRVIWNTMEQLFPSVKVIPEPWTTNNLLGCVFQEMFIDIIEMLKCETMSKASSMRKNQERLEKLDSKTRKKKGHNIDIIGRSYEPEKYELIKVEIKKNDELTDQTNCINDRKKLFREMKDSLDQILLLFEDTPKPHKLMVWGISHCELSGIIYGMDNPFGLDYYRLFTFGRYNLPSSFSNIGDLLMSIKLLLQLKMKKLYYHSNPTSNFPISPPLPCFSNLNEAKKWKPELDDELDEFNIARIDLNPRPNFNQNNLTQDEKDKADIKVIVCHDYAGGYKENHFDLGYSIQYWQYIDIFIYFSHQRIAIPPSQWTNAAHRNGVKVLGTFLTEHENDLFENDLLMAEYYNFDGWFINIETELIGKSLHAKQIETFVKYLTEKMHQRKPGSIVIWYDSVIKDGRIKFQNCLNELNYPFFNAADGIFINYFWKENYPKLSADKAELRKRDVYTGIDALEVIKSSKTSCAIFAPGWTYENFGKDNFWRNDQRFWIGKADHKYAEENDDHDNLPDEDDSYPSIILLNNNNSKDINISDYKDFNNFTPSSSAINLKQQPLLRNLQQKKKSIVLKSFKTVYNWWTTELIIDPKQLSNNNKVDYYVQELGITFMNNNISGSREEDKDMVVAYIGELSAVNVISNSIMNTYKQEIQNIYILEKSLIIEKLESKNVLLVSCLIKWELGIQTQNDYTINSGNNNNNYDKKLLDSFDYFYVYASLQPSIDSTSPPNDDLVFLGVADTNKFIVSGYQLSLNEIIMKKNFILNFHVKGINNYYGEEEEEDNKIFNKWKCWKMPRPEYQAPPEIYYNDNEAKKYTSNSRIQTIQADMTYRALELLNIPEGKSCFLLDIGCGSGLSGEILEEEGHIWVGMDISPSMLNVAIDREVEGDLFLQDVGEGMGFRPGTFDGAISISVLQWLCNADYKSHNPRSRLNRFFTTLYSSLHRGARAVFQFYPENDDQCELIMNIAMRCGFEGGLVVDYPNSKKAKKYFLCLSAGQSSLDSEKQQLPKALGEEVYDDDDEQKIKSVAYSSQRDWVLHKKEIARMRGQKQIPIDTKYTGRKRNPKF
ncbi:6442_t:CDS:10, partial [Entrophospora sp. SA101]